MKPKDVMEVLGISRSALRKLRKEGRIEAIPLLNGRYEYDEKSVYRYLLEIMGRLSQRKTVIYARVT